MAIMVLSQTVHISWFDLTDVFGSISHDLIQHCCKHFNIPEKERLYIHSLYSQLIGKVVTKDWISEVFKFLKGIFQGDPYSSSIFLVVFQPLIDFIIESKKDCGYKLGDSKVLSTPFADDFNLISWHLKKNQNIMLEVQKKTESMCLTFKPSKCRSLSVKSGKVVDDCKFYLVDGYLDKIFLKKKEDDPQKFLGSTITHMNTAADHFQGKITNHGKKQYSGGNIK